MKRYIKSAREEYDIRYQQFLDALEQLDMCTSRLSDEQQNALNEQLDMNFDIFIHDITRELKYGM